MVRYSVDGVRAVVLPEAVAAMSKPPCVTHRWRRVGPFVVPIGESWRFGSSEKTYNAECQRCGRREWLHWPEPVYPKLRWRL